MDVCATQNPCVHGACRNKATPNGALCICYTGWQGETCSGKLPSFLCLCH